MKDGGDGPGLTDPAARARKVATTHHDAPGETGRGRGRGAEGAGSGRSRSRTDDGWGEAGGVVDTVPRRAGPRFR